MELNDATDNDQPKDKKKKDKDKKKKISRTVETMYRSTLTNHVELSGIADQKAGLLVSVNAIIVSVMVSLLMREIATNRALLLPTVILLVTCILTITIALLATRPSVSKSPSHDLDRSPDLLFFADYTKLSLPEYQAAMQEMMRKESSLHEQLIQNIYAQGTVLKRKYRLIKTAYTIFMVGFPAALICYLLVFYGA
jgi:Family of unknown function (DUF5706)